MDKRYIVAPARMVILIGIGIAFEAGIAVVAGLRGLLLANG